MVLLGLAWFAMVCYGLIWFGMYWYGLAWFGMVWYSLALFGMDCIRFVCQFCIVQHSIKWFCMVLLGMDSSEWTFPHSPFEAYSPVTPGVQAYSPSTMKNRPTFVSS